MFRNRVSLFPWRSTGGFEAAADRLGETSAGQLFRHGRRGFHSALEYLLEP